MRLFSLAITGSLLFASACTPGPITGGPCTYETSEITARLIEVSGDKAVFEGPFGEFSMPLAQIGGDPEVGQMMKFSMDAIISGTCTPYMYSYIGE